MQKLIKFLANYYVNLVFYISLLAVIGSLYFSNIAGLIPCELCWYQRVFMYPIPIISGASLLLKQKVHGLYLLGLSVPGALIAIYHYLIQFTDIEGIIPGCSLNNPCGNIDFILLGFITIPLLSLAAFLPISIVAAMPLIAKRLEEKSPTTAKPKKRRK